MAGLLPAGCGSRGGPAALERQRSAVSEAWAETLGSIRVLEALELDRRVGLAEQQTSLLEAELALAERAFAEAAARKKTLLAQMESGGSPEAANPPASQPDAASLWPELLGQVQAQADESAIRCVAVQQRLHQAKSELADLRRLAARRDMLVRLAADQERSLRELDRRLGN